MNHTTEEDDEQFIETLAKRYPALFEKSKIDYLGVGKGWYNIINVLCQCIYSDYERADSDVGYQLKQETVDQEKFDAAVKARNEAWSQLPVIAQVKEKFGSLRFYTYNSNDKVENYIRFAEAMSNHTCEDCGSPGEARSGGWVKVLCDKHHKERESKRKY